LPWKAPGGAWGVSPHLIPHRTLHSLSGTISQALGIHGPNLGVGGGPESAVEIMHVAGVFLAEGRFPGLWVVLSGWDPEPPLERPGGPSLNGHAVKNPACIGIALALLPPRLPRSGPQVQIVARSARHSKRWPGSTPRLPPLGLESLAEALACPDAAGAWRLGKEGHLEIRGSSLALPG
jgi:hypothetical protein